MARDNPYKKLSPPRIYILRMTIFLILTGFTAAILYPQVQRAFLANPGLNGLIVGVLLGFGTFVLRLVRLMNELAKRPPGDGTDEDE